MLTMIDEFTIVCLTIVVVRRLNSDDVLHCLTELFIRLGLPDQIRSDNESEFTAADERAPAQLVNTRRNLEERAKDLSRQAPGWSN